MPVAIAVVTSPALKVAVVVMDGSSTGVLGALVTAMEGDCVAIDVRKSCRFRPIGEEVVARSAAVPRLTVESWPDGNDELVLVLYDLLLGPPESPS